MHYDILHRDTGAVLYGATLPDDAAGWPESRRRGEAARQAVAARANLGGANLVCADLADACLAGADLVRANLVRANLGGANLARANLAYADLAGADLADADLSGADLSGANLSGTNLAYANLAGADLAGANLARAKWRDDIMLTRAPLQLYGLAYPVTVLDSHLQIGCELHTLTDWAAFDDRRIAEMGGQRALRFWHAHKAALLALAASDGRT